MDKSALTQAMKASISEVLEQMFFMPIEFTAPIDSGGEPLSVAASLIARIGFCGSPSGTFVLVIPLALAQSVSADFLGLAVQSLSDDQVTGTVLEMVNMLAGGTLSKYDHQALFDLQIPELITFSHLRTLTEGGSDPIVIGIHTLDSWMTFQLIEQ